MVVSVPPMQQREPDEEPRGADDRPLAREHDRGAEGDRDDLGAQPERDEARVDHVERGREADLRRGVDRAGDERGAVEARLARLLRPAPQQQRRPAEGGEPVAPAVLGPGSTSPVNSLMSTGTIVQPPSVSTTVTTPSQRDWKLSCSVNRRWLSRVRRGSPGRVIVSWPPPGAHSGSTSASSSHRSRNRPVIQRPRRSRPRVADDRPALDADHRPEIRVARSASSPAIPERAPRRDGRSGRGPAAAGCVRLRRSSSWTETSAVVRRVPLGLGPRAPLDVRRTARTASASWRSLSVPSIHSGRPRAPRSRPPRPRRSRPGGGPRTSHGPRPLPTGTK
jgi:hypothetical protein